MPGLSEPGFYGDLVCELGKIVGSNNLSAQFIKMVSHYKRVGCCINMLRRTACLVVVLVMFGGFGFLFDCTPVSGT